MHWVVHEQPAVYYLSVRIAVRDSAYEDCGAGVRSIARSRAEAARHSAWRVASYVRARIFMALRDVGQSTRITDTPLVELSVLTPGKDRPGSQHRVEELYRRHMKMRGVAPGEEIQRLRIIRTRIYRPGAHGQPDRGACELGTVGLGVTEIRDRGSAQVGCPDRIGDPVLSGRDAHPDREETGRACGSPILVGPCAGGHVREHEQDRCATLVHVGCEGGFPERHVHSAANRLDRFGWSADPGQLHRWQALLPRADEIRPGCPVIDHLQLCLGSSRGRRVPHFEE